MGMYSKHITLRSLRISLYLMFILIILLSSSIVSAEITINTYLDEDFTKQSNYFGENGKMYVTVYNGVSCCSTQAMIISPKSIQSSQTIQSNDQLNTTNSLTILMHDDGTEQDNKANDGIFRGVFTLDSTGIDYLGISNKDEVFLFTQFSPISSKEQKITAEYDKPSTVVLDVNLDGKNAALSWNQADDFSGISHYIIYKSKDVLTDGTNLGSAKQIISYKNSYTDKNLKDGDGYYYAVAAVDILGNFGELSNQKIVSINDYTEPAQVEILKAEYKNNGVHLYWSQSDDNSEVVSYLIYRDTKEINKELKTSYDQTSVAKYVDSKLLDGSTYYYAIVAVDGSGNKAKISDSIKVEVDITPPQKPKLSYKIGKDGEIILSWNLTETVDQFYLYSSATENVELVNPIALAGTTTTYTDAQTEPRYYVLAGVDIAGNIGDLSREILVVPDLEKPVAITNLQASVNDDGTINLHWEHSNSPDILAYKIYRSLTKDFTFEDSYYTTTDNFLHDTAVETEKIYYYIVRAIDQAGNEEQNANSVEAVSKDSKVFLELWYPENNQEVRRPLVILGGKIEPESSLFVTVNNNNIPNKDIILDTKGVFLIPVELIVGSNVITLKAVDKNNNVETKHVVVQNLKESVLAEGEIDKVLTLLRGQLLNGELRINNDAAEELKKVTPDFIKSSVLQQITGYSVGGSGKSTGFYTIAMLLFIILLAVGMYAYQKTFGGNKKQQSTRKDDIFDEDYFDKELNKDDIDLDEKNKNDFY